MRSLYPRSWKTRSISARFALCAVALALVAGGAESTAPEADGASTDGAAADAAAADALARIQARYDAVGDFRARFVQTSLSAALGEETIAAGQVVMKRPGRIRWQYAPPDSRVILVDDESIRLYDPGEAQLQIAPLAGAGMSPTALHFLLGEAVLAEVFSARLLASDPDAAARLGLDLLPRADRSFESLHLWVDAKSYQLRESVVVDLFGNRTSLRFDEVVENGGVDDDAFELEVPDGTQVIDLRVR